MSASDASSQPRQHSRARQRRPASESPLRGGSGTNRQAARAAKREAAARLHGARRRGLSRLIGLILMSVASVVLLLTLTSGTTNPESLATSHHPNSIESLYAPKVRPMLSTYRFAGKSATLPLPKVGEGAVAVAGLGLVGSTAREKCVPIASVTKIMTAYLVLKDHPLVGNEVGPVFVMTKADHAAWIAASEEGDSNIEILAGERLDELQLLQALMIQSADNVADYLARWDAGSIPAFVRKMNTEAAALGMGCTHYADASGVNPLSRSNAADQALFAGIAMQNPELRFITDELHLRLPVSGEIWNVYNPAVGVDGIIGVKSGFTDAAQVCLVTAAWRHVGTQRVLVVSAVIRQPLSMWGAAREDEALLDAVTHELVSETVVPASAEVGMATAAWSKQGVPVRIGSAAVTAVGWPGLTLTPVLLPADLSPKSAQGWKAGSTAATLELRSNLGTWSTAPATLSADFPPAPPGWSPAGLSH